MCGGIIMVVFKFFTVGDYEKLEHWINKMCFKGYALKDYSFGRFYFEPCIENEYYYSIELFENLPSSLSSEDFFNYLNDECNIEYVCKFRNFAFFRRKKSKGKFSLFTDISQKVSYFKRILTFRFSLALFLIVFSFLILYYPPLYLSDKVFSFLLLFIAIMIIIVNISSFFKYEQLKKIDKS